MPKSKSGYYLDIEKASQYFNVSERTIRRRIKKRELESKKENGKLYVFIDNTGQYSFDDLTNPKTPEVNNTQTNKKHAKNVKFEAVEGDNTNSDELLKVIIKQLDQKDKQIEKQGEQITGLTERLKELNYTVVNMQKALPNPTTQQDTPNNNLTTEQVTLTTEQDKKAGYIFIGLVVLIIGFFIFLFLRG